ncbi:MAG TPA: hypothetical protein DCS93_22230 [Microscillaceae bacterium]|nr:hypothetical protein [Microscillaceae bacterium]
MGFYYPNRQGHYFANLKQLLDEVPVEQVIELTYYGGNLPKSLVKLSHLKRLTLYDVLEVPETLTKLPHLREIQLLSQSYANIGKLQSYTLNLPHLKKIIFDAEYFRKLNPVSFTQLSSLEILQVENDYLEEFPEYLLNLTALKKLCLNRCSMSNISARIQELAKLEELNLMGNYLKELPDSIGQLTELRVLILRNNRLRKLPESIQGLKKLQYLDCDHNSLKTLPHGVGGLKHLQELTLQSNKLQVLPDEIVQCKALHYLDLTSNQINCLPTEIGELTHLKKLNLPKNKLINLPESLGNFPNLQQLILNNNPLEWAKLPLQVPGFRALMLKYIYQIIQDTDSAELAGQLAHFPPTLEQHPLQKDAVIAKIGKTGIKVNSLKPELGTLGIKYQAKFDAKVTHLVMGRLPKLPIEELLNHSFTFISEAQLNTFIESQQAPDPSKYLLQPDNALAAENIENLKNLLLSEDDQNIAIAIELIKGGGFPKELHTELFMAYKMVSEPKVRKGIKPLLEKYSSEKAKEAMRLRHALFTESMDEMKLRRNINKYTKDNEFDGPKIARYFWDRYKKGILYLFSYGSGEQILNVLPKGDVLNLNEYTINALPGELAQLTTLKKVYLNGCSFMVFPKVLLQMPQIEVLHMERNYLEKLPQEITKMKGLKELSMSFNLIKTLPEVLLEMPHLEKIMIKSWYEPRIDTAMLEKVKEKLPNCELIYL